ncbi:MORN repeat-containing protein 5 [Drosophila persimilis]|nr:MORN repeat-containing protein 5 [Drosophila persimilis]
MERYTTLVRDSTGEGRSIDGTRNSNFPTGTKFFGQMNELGMQDYGTYTYPDGSRYVGYFRNNHFHGSGSIQLPAPLGVSFQVTHHDGKLLKIDEMVFDDQLKVDFARMKDGSVSFHPWKYCSSEDRRFFTETRSPLAAVGPYKYQTQDGPSPPDLPLNVFDLGFGRLHPQGYLMDLKHGSPSIYVGCRKVRHWIMENCRHGKLTKYHLRSAVKAKFDRQIMKNNLEVNQICQKTSGGVPPIPIPGVCHRSKSQQSSESAKETRLHAASTSDSCSSKIDRTVKKEPRRKCRKTPTKGRREKRSDTSETHACRIN